MKGILNIKMNRFSIKAKITLWYTLIIFVISAAVLFIMLSVSHDALISNSERKLIAAVEHVVPMVDQRDPNRKPPQNVKGEAPPEDFRKLPGFMFFREGVHTAVYDEQGNLLSGAIPFEFIDDIEFVDSVMQEKVFDEKKYLAYSKKIQDQSGAQYWAVGVISIADESVLFESVSKTNIILAAILLCVAALGGYLILRQAFKPVDKIRNTAKLISESRDLSQRINLQGGKDEIYRLADTFDEMLEKIEKTLNSEKQFTSDASHELRTPVAVISSECEYALECAQTLDEAKESVASIKQQSDKMTRLISELLTISRMDKKTMEINLENIDISELLGFVCDEQEEIHSENIQLKRKIKPGVTLTTDSMLLARIFINLISNAYSYGNENGNIEVLLSEDDKEVVFKVIDDGIGISEENLPKIWERFYQVNPSRTNTDGNMGLGLSMVKLFVDKLGGTVTAESKIGYGTTFTVIMPKK